MGSGTPATVTRLDSLTGLRFFAAFAVFAFHSLHYGHQTLGTALFFGGPTGVSFFYVVSGFVMAWTARPSDTAVRFYRRRFARIYPAYVVAWLVSLAILVLQGRRPGAVDLLPLSVLQSWFPSSTFYWATNAVFWSLSCEAFFYLAFPAVRWVLARLSVRATVAGGAVLLAVVLALAAVTNSLGHGPVAYWLVAVCPLTRLPEFALGAAMGTLLSRGLRVRIPLVPAAFLAVGAFEAAGHVPAAFAVAAVTLVPFSLLVWSAASADLEGRRSAFRARPLVLLGTWSYAFYLVHTQAMTAWFEALDRGSLVDKRTLSGLALLLAVGGALACGVAAAFTLHRLVEVPMERRLRPADSRPNSLLDEVPVRPVPANPSPTLLARQPDADAG